VVQSLILAICIFLWCCPVVGQELPTSVYKRISPAIVRIETEENSGTGFIIRSDGTIVTALGIIDGATSVKVITEKREVYDNVSMLAKDERRGIAIIRAPGFGLGTVEFGDSDNLGQQQIFMIGRSFAPVEMSLTERPGRVLGVNYSDRGHKVISIADPIPNEAFGGPIVDSEGRVIAIAVFQEDWKFAIPINDIRGLLDYAEHNKPIVQWGSKPVDVSPWSRFLIFWRGILTSIYNSYPWLIFILVVGFVIYCLMSLVYSKRASKAEEHPWLAPISVSGELFADFSARDAAMEISTHMFELEKITAHKQEDIKETNIASLSSVYRDEVIRRLTEVQFDVQLRQLQSPALQMPDVAEIGLFKVPIREIATLAKMLFRWIPMRSRERYHNALIYISLTSTGSEAHLWVRRGDRYLSSSVLINSKGSDIESDSKGSDVESHQATVYERTGPLTLLHDAVFMILELMQDKDLPGRNWLGKKCFVGGLKYLDQSLRACRPELMDKAVNSFFQAAEADDKNYVAWYIKGHTLNAERKGDSNTLAEEVLKRALNAEDFRLKALVHAELTNCYSQQYFRLARRKAEAIKKAQVHIEHAYKCWEKATSEKEKQAAAKEHEPHAWILAAHGFVQVLAAMNEDKDSSESTESYKKAAKLYFRATKIEENNSAYLNALGFTLLKLTEQGHTELDLWSHADNLNVPQQSEDYLQMSLEVDPLNKLVHANLCLLYATDWYRDQEENREKYLELSRYHGLEAVKLDSKYVHGYRDLAKSLIRYEKIKEARDNFKKAMNWAQGRKKKEEIKCEIESVLDEMGISKEGWCD